MEIKETELTPQNCPGYHENDKARNKVHICNKCYNPQKGYDMEYF